MRNIRAEIEATAGRRLPDQTWKFLLEKGYVSEIEEGTSSVAKALSELKELTAAVVPFSQPEQREHRDQPTGAAGSARIDALTAIYAAWAAYQPDVRSFRSRALVDHDAPEFLAWVRGQGEYPDPRLLHEDEVDRWVMARFHADATDGDGDRHIRELVAQALPNHARPVAHLWYISDNQERVLTVDATGSLGDLVKLANRLAEQYRWRASEAATFVLTGRAAEVYVYVGSAQIRRGEMAATTRVTMTVDPFLTPDEVAGIYSRLRKRFLPAPPPRSAGVRRYRLAGHVGPHVLIQAERPADRIGPGRRPRPGPAGFVQTIQPTGHHTWQSLRRSWNERYSHEYDERGRLMRYDSASNFIRDAQTALRQLLFPNWRHTDDTSPTSI